MRDGVVLSSNYWYSYLPVSIMSSENLGLSEVSLIGGNRSKIPPRERILAAARELFYARGIRAVSVDAIAEAADTNKMTLYRHFESKDELVSEYLRGVAKEYQGQWNGIASAYAGDPRGQLSAWIDHLAVGHGDDDRGCPFANAAVELPEKDHPARAVIEATKSLHREKLAELCREARFYDPEGLANQIVLLFEGAQIDRQCGGCCGKGPLLFDMIRTLIENHPKAN
jgi:AcrR family transcriptional regulator